MRGGWLCEGAQSKSALTPPLWRPSAKRFLHEEGLNELESLCMAEWLQGNLCKRQVPAQVGELRGELRVEIQPFTAPRTQQQHPPAIFFPGPFQVAQQVEC